MSAVAFRSSFRFAASRTLIAAIRNRRDSTELGSLAILASTTTGEVADTTRTPAGARTSWLMPFRTRSTLDA
ncbi:MAG: hypothetical protein ABWX82_07855 [Leifsonia sp.]